MATECILDPRAPQHKRSRDRGPGVGRLEGKRVGLRRDQFWEAWDWVTDEWATSLRADGADPVMWRAPVARGDAVVAGTLDFDRFVTSIDVMIGGLCNCGSCSMWAVHDSLTALDHGVPTVTVATAHFERLARMLAAQGGREDVRMVVLPYPLEGRAEQDVREIARGAWSQVLDQLGVIPARGRPMVGSAVGPRPGR